MQPEMDGSIAPWQRRRSSPRDGRLELRMIFPSDLIAVRTALGSALSGLRYLELSEEDSGTVELVLAEAMNNVVEHAYAGSAGVIELRVANCTDGLFCEVLDDGAGMEGLPSGDDPSTEPPAPLDDMPEGGFGWFLIRTLARDLSYTREAGRNRLSFRIDLADPVRAH